MEWTAMVTTRFLRVLQSIVLKNVIVGLIAHSHFPYAIESILLQVDN